LLNFETITGDYLVNAENDRFFYVLNADGEVQTYTLDEDHADWLEDNLLPYFKNSYSNGKLRYAGEWKKLRILALLNTMMAEEGLTFTNDANDESEKFIEKFAKVLEHSMDRNKYGDENLWVDGLEHFIQLSEDKLEILMDITGDISAEEFGLKFEYN